MPTEKPRYCITVDEELLNQIDDFRFENRFASRSAATLELIRIGLEQIERDPSRVIRTKRKLSSKKNHDI